MMRGLLGVQEMLGGVKSLQSNQSTSQTLPAPSGLSLAFIYVGFFFLSLITVFGWTSLFTVFPPWPHFSLLCLISLSILPVPFVAILSQLLRSSWHLLAFCLPEAWINEIIRDRPVVPITLCMYAYVCLQPLHCLSSFCPFLQQPLEDEIIFWCVFSAATVWIALTNGIHILKN